MKRSNNTAPWSGHGPPPVPSKPEMVKNINNKKRQDELEQRHQELLARQRQLQVRKHVNKTFPDFFNFHLNTLLIQKNYKSTVKD